MVELVAAGSRMVNRLSYECAAGADRRAHLGESTNRFGASKRLVDSHARTIHRYPDRFGEPAMTWLSPKAEVRPSGIEGRGLFAATRVAEGQHLLLDRTHPACYGNHSCDPNLWRADAVTGGDWRLPHLQEAYADHWTPPLLDRIRSATPATVRHRPEISKLSVAV